jgi:glycosyltransferase involved in cell wall biosynthesis
MNKNAKTLVVISPGFPVNEQDTSSLPLQQNLIKAIHRNYPEIKIIVLSLQFPYINAAYKWNNIDVISFNGRHRPKLHRLLLWFRVWRTLLRLKKENNIIALLSFWAIETALIGKYFAKIYKLKHLIWILGQDAKKQNQYIKRINPKSENLVALSDFIAEEFYRNHHIKPKHIIIPGIDTSIFPDVNIKRNIDILGVGSLIPLKQYDVFIEVVSELKRQFPHIKACICGYGPEEENLVKLINKLGLTENISLMGELPNAEILQLMQRTKVFLHTSIYEGFGVVCMEALYAGAQVISFCKPLNREIENWHIAKDKTEMAEKALTLFQQEKEEYKRICISTIDETARSFMKLID